MHQLNEWTNPSKISVIIPECFDFFNNLAKPEKDRKGAKSFYQVIQAVLSRSASPCRCYKEALLGEFGGSGPKSNLPLKNVIKTSQPQNLSLEVLGGNINYSVRMNDHSERGSVIIIDGWQQSKNESNSLDPYLIY